jgi:hypothetical protein
MKTYGGRGYIAPLFLTSAADGGEWSASCPGRLSSWGKNPRYPLHMRPSGPQSRPGHCGAQKNLFPLPGIEHRPFIRRSSLYCDFLWSAAIYIIYYFTKFLVRTMCLIAIPRSRIIYWNPQIYKCYPFIKRQSPCLSQYFLNCQEHHVFRLKRKKFNEVCHEMQDIIVEFSATNCQRLQ